MTSLSHELPDGLRPAGRYAEWRAAPPRYMVADVDGTLLGASHVPTAAVVAAVAACRGAGLALGLATGRMPAAVRDLLTRLDAHGPHVVHNGAQVVDDAGIVATWPLPPAEAVLLRERCAQLGLYAEFYVGQGYRVTDRRASARRHWELLGAEPDGLVDDVDLGAVEVVKATVLLFDHDDHREALEALTASGLTAGAAGAPALPDVTFLNVTHPDADKGRALAVAAARLGCGLDAVAAVGDGLNDLSMLAVAGTAIAMGQSPPQVQAAAHFVVPEVDADGVAHALRAVSAWCARAA